MAAHGQQLLSKIVDTGDVQAMRNNTYHPPRA
jgi:hypothetical protein